jgi:membrane associated rhomboid family serine protease
MDDLDPAGEAVGVDQGVQARIVALADDDGRGKAELDDRSGDELEGANVGADEESAFSFGQGVGQDPSFRGGDPDAIEGAGRRPSEQQALGQGRADCLEGGAGEAGRVGLWQGLSDPSNGLGARIGSEEPVGEAEAQADPSEHRAGEAVGDFQRQADEGADQVVFGALGDGPVAAQAKISKRAGVSRQAACVIHRVEANRMTRSAARVCPHCGALNATEDERCYRCQRRIPGPWIRAVGEMLGRVLGDAHPVTHAAALLSALVFVLMSVEQGGIEWMGASPEVARSWGALFVEEGSLQPWRYLSASFVHFGVLHVGINSMMLISFGRELEGYLGGPRLALVFLASSLIGFFASDVYYGLSGVPTVTAGASAGVAGMLGAYIAILIIQKNPAWKRVSLSLAVYAVVFALALPGRVNHVAHAGGFAAGWVLAQLFHRYRGAGSAGYYRKAAWAFGLATALSIAFARVTA